MSDREIDTMNTSFIDLICCALGSVLMLMLFVACLVRASVDRTARSPESEDEGRALLDKGDEGFANAPPSPLIVTLEWSGKAKYPPRLTAYPPRSKGKDLVPQLEEGLTEANGVVRLKENKEAYFGFFTRHQDRTGRLKLVIPRSRSTSLDRERRQARLPLEANHAHNWRFKVEVPGVGDEALEARRAAPWKALEAIRDLRLEVREGEAEWNVEDKQPLPPLPGNGPGVGLPLVELRDSRRSDGAYSQEDVRQALATAGKVKLDPDGQRSDATMAATHRDSTNRVVRAFWVAGFDDQKPDQRAQELARLWREVLLPDLRRSVRLPDPRQNADRPAAEKEVHESVLRSVARVEEALKKANANLKRPAVPLSWEDLTKGPPEKAVPGSAAWLDTARQYARVFAGTGPDGGAIRVQLKVEAFPQGRELWRSGQEGEITLEKGEVWFSPPK